MLVKLLTFLSKSPFWVLYGISKLSYLLVYKLFGYRKRVVRTNLGMAFPELYKKELVIIEKAFYAHFFDLIVETIKLPALSKDELLSKFTVENNDLLNRYCEQNQDIIVVMGHTGNWEWSSGVGNLVLEHHLQTLYQPLKNQHLDDYLKSTRELFGTECIPRKKALRTLLSQQNSQPPKATIFLADQSPYEMEKASWHNFLNLQTPFFKGYASISKKLNLPIVYLHIFKTEKGSYKLQFHDLISDPSIVSTEEIVRSFAKKLESGIREQPYNWLWTHKRWKRMHLKPTAHV